MITILNNNIVELKLKNLMEEVVENVLDNLKSERSFCDCDICRLDIIAYTLNNVPPKYVVTKIGEAYSKVDHLHSQFKVDVTMALYEAIEVIKKKPRH